MSELDELNIPLHILICDADSYPSIALKHVLDRISKVYEVNLAFTLDEARSHLRSGGVNAIIVDPFALGVKESSTFIFSIRDVFPEIVFVLYVDFMETMANEAWFYADQRARFYHYFKLDKQTPLLHFEEQVYGILRAITFELHGNLPSAQLKQLLNEGGSSHCSEKPAPTSPQGTTDLQDIFSLNLGELRSKVANLVDDSLKGSALHLIADLSRIDRIGKIDPEAALGKARAVTECVVAPLYTRHIDEKVKPLFDMIEELYKRGHLPSKIWSLLHTVRVVGNLSVHYQIDPSDKITPADVSLIGMITAQIIEWYISFRKPI